MTTKTAKTSAKTSATAAADADKTVKAVAPTTPAAKAAKPAAAPKEKKATATTAAKPEKKEKAPKAPAVAKPDAGPSKKSLALPVIVADLAAGVARKDTIAKLQAEGIGCSAAGANTYYQNVKSGAWK